LPIRELSFVLHLTFYGKWNRALDEQNSGDEAVVVFEEVQEEEADAEAEAEAAGHDEAELVARLPGADFIKFVSALNYEGKLKLVKFKFEQ
jgi:hypothetical protein